LAVSVAAVLPGEQGVTGGSHVVDAQHIGVLFRSGDGDSDGAGGTFLDRTTQDSREEAFA
jgi:hypothetical protein